MYKEIALQWADALESGKYKQGRGKLRRGDKFCCLGVLCNLHAQAHPEIAAAQKKPGIYMGEVLGLSKEVAAWAGMDNSGLGEFAFELDNAPNAGSLADLNDQDRFTFKQIAEVIRVYHKEL